MPEPISDAAARRVEELLREGLSAVEVSRRCIGRWPLVTPARVRMEAYRLGIALLRGSAPGERRSPGRPVGSADRNPRAPRSDKPSRILQMWTDGERNQIKIADQLGISRQYVSKVLKPLLASDADTK